MMSAASKTLRVINIELVAIQTMELYGGRSAMIAIADTPRWNLTQGAKLF
jgi:hypothetical protein